MFRVSLVSNSQQEFGLAGRSTHVFGRASIAAGDAQRVTMVVDRLDTFDLQGMFPSIAEVVFVVKISHARAKPGGERCTPIIGHYQLWPFVVRDSVFRSGDLKFVQMAVRPTHGDLQHQMQLGQGDPAWHQEAAPDRWRNLEVLTL